MKLMEQCFSCAVEDLTPRCGELLRNSDRKTEVLKVAKSPKNFVSTYLCANLCEVGVLLKYVEISSTAIIIFQSCRPLIALETFQTSLTRNSANKVPVSLSILRRRSMENDEPLTFKLSLNLLSDVQYLPNPLGVLLGCELCGARIQIRQCSQPLQPGIVWPWGRCSAMHLEISRCDRPHLQGFPRTAAPNTFWTWPSLAFLSFEHSSLLPSHLCENKQQARLDSESPGLLWSAASNQSTCPIAQPLTFCAVSRLRRFNGTAIVINHHIIHLTVRIWPRCIERTSSAMQNLQL